MTQRMLRLLAILLGVVLFVAPALAAEKKDADTYDQDSVLKDATEFFGKSTEGLATVIEKAFKDHGRPNAYIKGEEASGALTVGLRYGDGVLVRKKGKGRKVHWSGPSIGFDFGGNAAKVFVLVYHLDNSELLFRRWTAAFTSSAERASIISREARSSSRRSG